MTGPPRRALLAVNRHSRNGHLGAAAAAATLRAAGLDVLEADCGADFSARIRTRRDAIDCVVLGGGDGTVNAAAAALLDSGLPLGVLPLGTANDFARSIGIPLDLEAAARVIADGVSHRIDLGEVNGHAFLNVASVGMAADLARSLTTQRKRRFGRFSYALTAARLLLQAEPFHATLLVGPAGGGGTAQEKFMVRTLQITVGNGRYYGGGNIVAEGARIDDGALDLYSLEFAQVWRRALLIPSFARGTHGAVREVRTARAQSFEIITRKPRPVNADGELLTQTPAIFTQKRRALAVYVPESCPLRAGGSSGSPLLSPPESP